MKSLLDPTLSGDFDANLVRMAQSFAETHIGPNAESWEQRGEYPVAAIRQATAQFGDVLIAKELGGRGGSLLTFLLILEEFAKADIGFTLAFVVQCNVALAISKGTNSVLRDEYLPKVMNGSLLGAFCLTEPHAGSDAAAIVTRAQLSEQGYAVSGSKAWVLNSQSAELLVLFAKTEAEGGAQAIAVFLADAKHAAITRSPPYRLISGNSTQVGTLTFENLRLDDKDILFASGHGFKAAMQALDAARLGIAAICNGALSAALGISLRYTADRRIFEETALDKQGMQWTYAEHLTQLEASRALTFSAAASFDRGDGTPIMAAHAKKFSNHAVANGISWAMRAMGANGALRSHALARQCGAVQLLFNTDGTPEVLNVIIGRALRREYSAVPHATTR